MPCPYFFVARLGVLSTIRENHARFSRADEHDPRISRQDAKLAKKDVLTFAFGVLTRSRVLSVPQRLKEVAYRQNGNSFDFSRARFQAHTQVSFHLFFLGKNAQRL